MWERPVAVISVGAQDERTWVVASRTGKPGENVRVAVAIGEDTGFRRPPIELPEAIELPVRRKVESVLHNEWKTAGPTSKPRKAPASRHSVEASIPAAAPFLA